MNKPDQNTKAGSRHGGNNALSEQVRQVIAGHRLDNQRKMIKSITAELNISLMDCAAAIAYLWGKNRADSLEADKPQTGQGKEALTQAVRQAVKFVRYRFDIGLRNNVTPEALKKVLVEESGVDIRNITNIRIQDSYTLIDLPDEMPQEIFQHLKTVEINNRKLDIKRLKPHKKKRGNRYNRHGGQKNAPLAQKTGG